MVVTRNVELVMKLSKALLSTSIACATVALAVACGGSSTLGQISGDDDNQSSALDSPNTSSDSNAGANALGSDEDSDSTSADQSSDDGAFQPVDDTANALGDEFDAGFGGTLFGGQQQADASVSDSADGGTSSGTRSVSTVATPS